MKKLLYLGLLVFCFFPFPLHGQTPRHIKVVVEFQLSGDQSRQNFGGSGGVIIDRKVRPYGRLSANEGTTRVQQSTGIFTLVQDGGESLLSVARKVPQQEVFFYRDYAIGAGHVVGRLSFQDVGTFLKVEAQALPQSQIRLKLTPRISYFSPEGSGAIDFTEAQSEIVVPNGSPVVIGGSTSRMHQVMRQILGYASREGSGESTITVTATAQ